MKKVFKSWLLMMLVAAAPAAKGDVESNGDALVSVLAVAPLAHSSFRADLEGVLQYGTGALSTQALTSVGKRATNKNRPNGNCCNAFPSSHSSAAFHSAFYVAERYSYLEALPYFAGAAYVAYSRVHANKHDFADVAAGAGLSLVVNHFATGNRAKGTKPRIGVYTGDEGGISLILDWRW